MFGKNDFKPISRIVFFRFGETNKPLFWLFSKKNFFNFLLVAYYISKDKKGLHFFFKLTIMVCYFTETYKYYSRNRLKIIHYVQIWQPDVKKLKTDHRTRFWNYLITDLVSWKLAYLISQPRTRIQQKVFRLKICPQGLGKIWNLGFYTAAIEQKLNIFYFFYFQFRPVCNLYHKMANLWLEKVQL